MNLHRKLYTFDEAHRKLYTFDESSSKVFLTFFDFFNFLFLNEFFHWLLKTRCMKHIISF